MRNLVIYDKSEQNLKCDNDQNIPLFCKECITNPNKRCLKHYKKLLESEQEGLYECPYGFSSYYVRNNIYTCIILKDKDQKKVSANIESHHQQIKTFNSYKESQITEIISDFEDVLRSNIELRDCMHDLRNIGSYFNSMSETIEIKHKDLAETDEDIKAMLALYDLINYRLNVFYGTKEADNQHIKAKLYPLLKKLKVMMSYQAKKKKVNIKIEYKQDNILKLSKNIYLAMFILLENAIKHSVRNSDINVEFEETDDYTIVSISNIGQIILEDEYEKIFERGYRGKKSISKGSGIGLSLVKQIFESHGYAYNVDITPISKETCIFKVSVKFPTANASRKMPL